LEVRVQGSGVKVVGRVQDWGTEAPPGTNTSERESEREREGVLKMAEARARIWP